MSSRLCPRCKENPLAPDGKWCVPCGRVAAERRRRKEVEDWARGWVGKYVEGQQVRLRHGEEFGPALREFVTWLTHQMQGKSKN